MSPRVRKGWLALGLIAAGLPAASLRAELDLHLQRRSPIKNAQDVTFIRDDGHDVLLSLPRGWVERDSPGNSLLLSAGSPTSQVRITLESDLKSVVPSAATADTLSRRAATLIPRGATDATGMPAVPLDQIRNFKGYQYTFKYNLYGQALGKVVTYVDVGKGRVLLIQADAQAGAIKEVQEALVVLLNSWVVPDLDDPPEVHRGVPDGTVSGG